MKEIDIMWLVKAQAEELGAYMWRNNTGGLYDKHGRFIRYGLCNGSSDLIGVWRGKFVAIEVKTHKGRLSDEQERFLGWVREKGGIAFVARSPEDVKKHLTGL